MAMELPDLSTVFTGPRKDLGPLLAHFREHDPVLWIPGLNAWIVTRHEDVRQLCSDTRVTADKSAHEQYRAPTNAKAKRWLGAIPFRATPADPESVGRRLVYKSLTPSAIGRARHQIEQVVEEFAAPIRKRQDVVNLIKDFTEPVSVTSIGRLLGIPDEGDIADRFRNLPRAARTIRPFLSGDQSKEAEEAGVEVSEFILELIEKRRDELNEGIITDLIEAAEVGERTSIENVVGVTAALVATGTRTPGNAGSRALLTLLQHPDQFELLRNDRSLLPNAVEELMRYDNGLVAMTRYVLEDIELRGRTLKKGQLVILSLQGANRDPSVFEDPDRVDITRDPRNSMAFGHGHHYCAGIHIARNELQLMIDAALDFLPPKARLVEDDVVWNEKGLTSQLVCLPVDLRG